MASEVDSAFAAHEPAGLLTLDLRDPARAAATAQAFARSTPVDAVVGVDDDTAVVAAAVARALGLPHNPLPAVEAARDKHRQRTVLRAAGVPVPDFEYRRLSETRASAAPHVLFPCVLKPVSLAASRGVMRANDAAQFAAARERLAAILRAPDVEASGRDADGYLVERYVPGPEFALEGLVVDGRLHMLALFDKPDPLEGPFFEETIYVTPSRSSVRVQEALLHCARSAVEALGLTRGPVHVELRHNDAGAWLIELAARPIGGKCGRALRFGAAGERGLEDIVLAHALGCLGEVPMREPGASGVMMIPIPKAGVLRDVAGVGAAAQVGGVTGIAITAHHGQRLVPLPDDARYLGFIFARAAHPARVEAALREAHARLEIRIE